MYADIYPELKKHGDDCDNFECVAEALETYFGDLFKLDALNLASTQTSPSSYFEAFQLCLKELKGLYTVEEVTQKIIQLLTEDTPLRSYFVNHFVFVPPKLARQIGFLEKLATGTLNMAEPLSFLDMLRAINGLEYHPNMKQSPMGVTVVSLNQLQALDSTAIQKNQKALLVNFNLDSKKAPKWGVVDLGEPIRVFCETPLTEREKEALETSLNIKVGAYLGETANSLVSTGYSALAWLDNNITHRWTFDVESDFSTMMHHVCIAETGGDNPGKIFNLTPNEVDVYCTKAFQALAASQLFTQKTVQGIDHHSFQGGSGLTGLNRISALGACWHKTFRPGDIGAVLTLLEKSVENPTAAVLQQQSYRGMRTNPAGLNLTLSQLQTPQLLQESPQSSILTIPASIDVEKLLKAHFEVCEQRFINEHVLSASLDIGHQSEPLALASIIVMTFVRNKAKKRELQITLPSHFVLSDEDRQFIIRTLQENVYVTEFKVNESNEGLKLIHQNLVPTLARNRWLEKNGYKPPLIDDYWQQAAKFWILHLKSTNNVLEETARNAFFHRCVLEMGLQGLNAVLMFLRDETHRELIEGSYEKEKPPFFVACSQNTYLQTIEILSAHLEEKNFFPFKSLRLPYHEGHDAKLIDLLQQLNLREDFEKVSLKGCMQSGGISDLLETLLKKAQEGHWTVLIHIEELEQSQHQNALYGSLYQKYALLNDLILKNRHDLLEQQLLKAIEVGGHWEISTAEVSTHEEKTVSEEAFEGLIDHSAIGRLEEKTSIWPLQRGGAVKLQIEQQQEMELSREVKQEQQKVVLSVVEEEPLPNVLISYQNIDEKLKQFVNQLSEVKPLNEASARLKTDEESLLQGFFHTFVNANPKVQGKNLIQYMTEEAAKVLLIHHERLTSGLNPEDLPKGFYTQTNKDGSLVLRYDPAVAYTTTPTPLTLSLLVEKPKAHAWQGDFRQFDLQKYLHLPEKKSLDENDLRYMQLFSILQPENSHKTQDFESFIQQNTSVAELYQTHRAKMIEHWPIFWQAWQFSGVEGISACLNFPDLSPNLSLLTELFFKPQSLELQAWAKEQKISGARLRAIGQVYHLYGDKGVALLLRKYQQIEHALGSEFFNNFSTYVLEKNENDAPFITEKFFMTMDDMIEKLKPRAAEKTRKLWQQILKLHVTSVGWEHVDSLWQGFDYFVRELTSLGIEIRGDEFHDVLPENMVVAMNRILSSIKLLPAKHYDNFMKHLGQFDLTHGGVHYAVLERICQFDEDLRLTDFVEGLPTYAPSLLGLYQEDFGPLQIKRTLAKVPHLDRESYLQLKERMGQADWNSKHQLLWLLHTEDMPNALKKYKLIEACAPSYLESMARYLHLAVYHEHQPYFSIPIEALLSYERYHRQDFMDEVMRRFPRGTFLAALNILHQSKRSDKENFERILSLFQANIEVPKDCPEILVEGGYQLATLFGLNSPTELKQFFTNLTGLRPVVQKEFRLLISQVLTVDYHTSDLDALRTNLANWQDLNSTLQEMSQDPAHAAMYRLRFIDSLEAQGIHLRFSKSGDFRSLKTPEEDAPIDIRTVIGYDERLWQFFKKHLVVPIKADAKAELSFIVQFFKRLQLNQSYLDEVEPLLSVLEQTADGQCWNAAYFYQVLKAFQPNDAQMAYPISLLKEVLQETLICAKPIHEVVRDFPMTLHDPLQNILQNTIFSREERILLAKLTLREFDWQSQLALIPQMMALFSTEQFAQHRQCALKILIKCTNYNQLLSQFENCRWLFQHPVERSLSSSWQQTVMIWLESLGKEPPELPLLQSIQNQFMDNPEKQSLLLHILAHSTLNQGLKDNASFESELRRKAEKLVNRLVMMKDDDFHLLAACYPKQPSPSADDILRMIKKHEQKGTSWKDCLDDFQRRPFSEARLDYEATATTRQADVARLISHTEVTQGGQREHIGALVSAQLTLIFCYLKDLECGEMMLEINGEKKPIAKMTQPELAKLFQALSDASRLRPEDNLLRAQIWAVLFEVLGRTTRKYPHLAQQFAFIANDVGLSRESRVLQLATGEGKSHYVALRAARYAGLGKVVDISTAKRSLAERDLEDYEHLFQYLGITTSLIHPKSTAEAYTKSRIHYSTLGDLSLFLDEQSCSGQPISVDRNERVGLFDEFDFIRFEEGMKTEYNYARPTGKTPRQMIWFYQTVNAFYEKHEEELNKSQTITVPILRQMAKDLLKAAGLNEEKQGFVKQLLNDPLKLVQNIQSGHETHELKWGIHFTVQNMNITIGGESYPLREIIPLSSDNQRMHGATYSGGVHQLLAVHLNEKAEESLESQNFHVHGESAIISSQVAAERMQELWSIKEGFSGTISSAEAAILYEEEGTEVLHVPTNRRSLRHWHSPMFLKTEDERMQALVKQLKCCLAEKKSILFSCKNDAEVKRLEKRLKSMLTRDEWESMMFYTNEDKRAPHEVLADKDQLEDYQGGKKQRAVGLVASGFGRGDNVGVEAVFLCDVGSTSDKLQKGGRTARNGDEGEVFQFYLIDELKAEDQRLQQFIDAHYEEKYGDDPRETLGDVPGETEDERCFERVMRLREYEFHLKNKGQLEYRKLIARFSSWNIQILSKIQDPAEKQEQARYFSQQLQQLEKEWLTLSSDVEKTSDERLTAIEAAILRESQHYQEHLGEMSDKIPTFTLRPHQAISIPWVISKPLALGRTEKAIGTLCSTFAQFKDLSLEDARVKQFPNWIEKLSKNEAALLKFVKKVHQYVTCEDFLKALEIAQSEASSAWEKIYAEQEAIEMEKTSLRGQNILQLMGKEWPDFAELMDTLKPLQDEILRYLQAPSTYSLKERVEMLHPILMYLKTFSLHEQKVFGALYLEDPDGFLQGPKALEVRDLISVEEPRVKPMHLQHLQSFWRLTELLSDDFAKRARLMHQLSDAINAAPEHRIRYITQFEAWISTLNKKEAIGFLDAFLPLMSAFQEGKNWHIWEKLVQKTHQWWHQGEDKYSSDLMILWQKMRDKVELIPEIDTLLFEGLALDGKSWFQVLEKSLSLPTDVLKEHHSLLMPLWHALDKEHISKSEKNERFQTCLKGLVQFFQRVQTLDGALHHKLNYLLKRLDPEKLNLVLNDIVASPQAFQQYPEMWLTILEKINDSSEEAQRLPKVMEIFCESVKEQPEDPMPQALFDFKDEKTMLDRVTLMHLLNDESFVPQYPHTTLDWDEEKNQALLTKAYKSYEDETIALVKETSPSSHQAVLRLAAEIKTIAPTAWPIPRKDPQVLIATIKDSMSQYKNILFKSRARERQLAMFEAHLTAIEHRHQSSVFPYQDLMELIAKARLKAMDEDARVNASSWFKINRKGHSRYLNTLLNIEKEVIAQWKQDVTELTRFEQMQTHHQHELMRGITQLRRAYDGYANATTTKLLSSLFFKSKKCTCFDSDLLQRSEESLGHGHEHLELIQEIITKIGEDLPKLPGDLQAIAKEVLERSRLLAPYLQESKKARNA